MMTLTFVIGTRPEAIKLSPVIREARGRGVGVTVVATDQHRTCTDVLAQLGVGVDHHLGVESRDHPGEVVGRVCAAVAVDPYFDRFHGDVVVVHGDTASALGAAMGARLRGLRVAHVEAGLRSDNDRSPWPEEMIRRTIASVLGNGPGVLHLATSARAKYNLENEGIYGRSVAQVGNPGLDALREATLRVDERRAEGVQVLPARFVLVTLHRREGRDGRHDVLRAVVEGAKNVGVSMVVVAHPSVGPAGGWDGVVVGPTDHLEMVSILTSSGCALVVTDSGGLQEECAALGVPTIVARVSTERPELERGFNRVGVDPALIRRWVADALNGLDGALVRRPPLPPGVLYASDYGDGHAAQGIVDALVGFASGS